MMTCCNQLEFQRTGQTRQTIKEHMSETNEQLPTWISARDETHLLKLTEFPHLKSPDFSFHVTLSMKTYTRDLSHGQKLGQLSVHIGPHPQEYYHSLQNLALTSDLRL